MVVGIVEPRKQKFAAGVDHTRTRAVPSLNVGSRSDRDNAISEDRDGLAAGITALSVLMAVVCGWGLTPRLAEYRCPSRC